MASGLCTERRTVSNNSICRPEACLEIGLGSPDVTDLLVLPFGAHAHILPSSEFTQSQELIISGEQSNRT